MSMQLSWVDPKPRCKPPLVQAIKAAVGRDSGALSALGTFGRSDRSSILKGQKCSQSPDGEVYLSRCQTKPNAILDTTRTCTMGSGERMDLDPHERSGKNCGPGTYDPKFAGSQSQSPLDGKQYCKTTMGVALPGCMVGKLPTHAMYQIRKDLDAGKARYKKEPMSHGTRHRFKEDSDGPGPGGYDQSHRTVGASVKPKVGKKDPTTPKKPKCTFGTPDAKDERCKEWTISSSPDGEWYYAHCKLPTAEEYFQNSGASRFGGGERVDFANPLKLSEGHRTQLSGHSYYPSTESMSMMRPSSLHGFVERSVSPVLTGSRTISIAKGFRRRTMPRSQSDGNVGGRLPQTRDGDDNAAGGGRN